MILLEEMKLLEEQQKSDEVKQNHIKLLLETAKVDIPQQQSQKVLETDELIEMLRSQARFNPLSTGGVRFFTPPIVNQRPLFSGWENNFQL